jgi:hypothetical protein
MSFRCDFCSLPQPPGTAPKMVVTKIRPREYNGIPGKEIAEEKKSCIDCIPAAEASVQVLVLAPKPSFYSAVEPSFDEVADH